MTMGELIKKYQKQLRLLVLVSIMVIPFGLYYAAINDMTTVVNGLLGGMGLSMIIALIIG